jgi:diaminopimelate epimerase
LKALLPFTKYHGVGNDFILIDARDLVSDPELWRLFVEYKDAIGTLAPYLCDRHFGVGADGVILALPLGAVESSEKRKSRAGDMVWRHDRETTEASKKEQFNAVATSLIGDYPDIADCDFGWIYTNSDGSPANMCGNGLRCLSLWAALKGGARSGSFTIATAKGKVHATVSSAELITVDIGEPVLEPKKIPMVIPDSASSVAYNLKLDDLKVASNLDVASNLEFEVTGVSMGNPHCVIFDDKGMLDSIKYNISNHSSFFNAELGNIARILQSCSVFPESANIEFVKVLSRDRVRCYVYERGCGFTLACASGAAAVAVAGVLTGRLDNKVTVELPGGPLDVVYDSGDKHVRITGPAAEVFSGVLRIDDLDSFLGKPRTLAEASC